MEIKTKTTEELESLNTKNLLRYYKAERARYFSAVGGQTCGCCGERYEFLYPNDENYKDESKTLKGWEKYLESIKDILNTREHVPTN